MNDKYLKLLLDVQKLMILSHFEEGMYQRRWLPHYGEEILLFYFSVF